MTWWNKLLVRGSLLVGFVLSVASFLNLCAVEACTQAHEYTLLGVSMPVLGMVFFVAAGIVFEIGRGRAAFSTLFSLLISGACGAEIAFILIQKYWIQKWCPLCLGVAASVYLIALVVSLDGIITLLGETKQRRTIMMESAKKILILLLIFTVGFFGAYRGMQKSEAQESVPNIFLGKQDSSVQVFIMTDWFCPACQKAEQEIEKAVQAVSSKAKIIFVDVPVHPESLNYTPYSLSFLTHEKNRYIELRKALLGLTKKTKNPAPEQVGEAVSRLNVTYKPLSFLEATNGLKFYDGVAKEWKVSSTPTIVISDTKTKKATRLVGVKEVTEANIVKAVDEYAR